MENRFSIKDFFYFTLLIMALVLLGFILSAINYQTSETASLRQQLKSTSRQEIAAIEHIGAIAADARTAGQDTGAASVKSSSMANIRETLPNGDRYVCYPKVPIFPGSPYHLPGYAPGDWLVQNLGEEPHSLIPYVPRSAAAADVQSLVLESLLARNPVNLHWDPWLARSYRVSKNGLKITFTLRHQARFSDGTPVLAKDVVFSFNTMMNPQVNDPQNWPYYSDVKSCRAVGNYIVIFTFKHPYFKTLENVGSFAIIPEHIYKFKSAKEYNGRSRLLVGSGPYMLKNWTPGQRMVLVKNPDYWGPPVTFQRIVYRFIQNPQAALATYLKGGIDSDGVEPSQWLKYTARPGFTKKNHCYQYLTSSSGFIYLGWNLKNPLFKDRLTRTALAMLIDRNAIIKTFMHSMALPVNGPFNPLSPQNDPNIKAIPYDPAKARTLLAKAGWHTGPNGTLERKGRNFKFSLLIPSQWPLGQKICVYMQHQFATAGINCQISPVQDTILLRRIDKRQFAAVIAGWTGGIEMDPYQIFDSKSYAHEGSNAGDFDNAEADKLISEGRREMNTAKRMKIWHQLQAIIYRQQPYLFLFTPDSLVFIQERFRNTKPVGKFGLNSGDWFVPLALQKYQ
jgi:peptide/nickel transport system substrate-binding protein